MSKYYEAYQRYLNGEPLEKIAKDYGITRERMRQIVKREELKQFPLQEPLEEISRCRSYLEEAAKGLIGKVDNDTMLQYNELVQSFDSFLVKLKELNK